MLSRSAALLATRGALSNLSGTEAAVAARLAAAGFAPTPEPPHDDLAAALLADILAHPDAADHNLAADDALRLAYADVIEPRDHARAELIRTQIARAGDSPHPSRRAATRARELLGHHGRGWAAVTDLVDGYRFYRGFVGQVTLSARTFLDRGARLYALAPITEVALRGGVRELADELFASPLLSRLRALDLAGQALGDAGVVKLAASPHVARLVALNLDENRVSLVGLRALAASPVMRGLRLASFAGNPDDPSAVHSGDDWELPPIGQELEDEAAGRIAWLHGDPSWTEGELEAQVIAR